MVAVKNGKAEKNQRNIPKEEPAFGEDGIKDLELEEFGRWDDQWNREQNHWWYLPHSMVCHAPD